MPIAQISKNFDNRVEKLSRNWDFWIAFAWVETRSIDFVETIHGYRTSGAVAHNPGYKVPVVITDLCKFKCKCGANSNCSQWQTVRRKLAELCIEGKLIASGVPAFSAPRCAIPQEEWRLEGKVDDPAILEIGNRYWSQIAFPASMILNQYPIGKESMIAPPPSPAALQKFVQPRAAAGMPMSHVWAEAKTHFINNRPTRRSVEQAYKVFTPYPTRGRPAKA